MLLKARYFIFKQKFEETSPSFDVFRKIMKSYYNLEKYNALKNGTRGKFEKAWNSYNADRQTRSTVLDLLHIPRSHSAYFDRAFSVQGPKLSNSLPADIRNSTSINV